jgi:hypothetical protein
MIINILYNDLNKKIYFDINSKFGEIQHKILTECSLLIYSIEYSQLIIKLDHCNDNKLDHCNDNKLDHCNDSDYNNINLILGMNNCLYSTSFKDFIIKYIEKYTKLINDSNSNIDSILSQIDNIFIIEIITYDRKRDQYGNVIKENLIINKYNEWFNQYENEKYLNTNFHFNNDNSTNGINNIIRFPFSNILNNIFRYSININNNEINSDNNEINNNENTNNNEINNNENTNNNEINSYNNENTNNNEINNNENTNNNDNDNEINSDNNEVNYNELPELIDDDIPELIDINNELNNIIFDTINHRNNNNNNIYYRNFSTINRFNNIENSLYNTLPDNTLQENTLPDNTLPDNTLEDNNSMYERHSRFDNIIDIFDNYIRNINNQPSYNNLFDFYIPPTNINNFENFEDIKIVLNEDKFNNIEKINFEDLNNEVSKECLICLEIFEKDDLLLKIKCNHIFHSDCIKSWLCKESNKCPVCRIDVDKGTIFEEN